MKITFLGTGASHGIPVIGCNCNTCNSSNEKDMRLRSSILVEVNNCNFVVDVGPDFRQQMLREKITRIDAVLFTHEHKDHTAGIDDLRAFNFLMEQSINVYAESRVLETIKQDYSYIFAKNKYPGTPQIDLHALSGKVVNICGVKIVPIRIFHGLLPIYGFRFGNFAYLTDIKTLPTKEIIKLSNLDVLVLSAIRIEPHTAHLGLDEVLEMINLLKPKKTYLTHISHTQYNYNELKSKLTPNIEPAFDGLKIELNG